MWLISKCCQLWTFDGHHIVINYIFLLCQNKWIIGNWLHLLYSHFPYWLGSINFTAICFNVDLLLFYERTTLKTLALILNIFYSRWKWTFLARSKMCVLRPTEWYEKKKSRLHKFIYNGWKHPKKKKRKIPATTLYTETANQMRQQYFGRLDNDLYWLYPIHNSLDKRSGVNLAVCCLHEHEQRMNNETIAQPKRMKTNKRRIEWEHRKEWTKEKNRKNESVFVI